MSLSRVGHSRRLQTCSQTLQLVQKIAEDKHSCLFWPVLNDKGEKKVYNKHTALVFQFGHIVKLLDLSLNDKIVKAKEH
jgi:hypothetical protein